MSDIKRYGLVKFRYGDADPERMGGFKAVVELYLTPNYSVAGITTGGVVIEGLDNSSLTLDRVIGSLAIGLMRCDEIDLSHPCMMELDEFKPKLPAKEYAARLTQHDVDRIMDALECSHRYVTGKDGPTETIVRANIVGAITLLKNALSEKS